VNDATSQNSGESRKRAIRVGFLSPWNQSCGLATYGKFLVDELVRTGLDVIVFAEQGVARTATDEGFVRRCWNRNQPQGAHDTYRALEEEIARAGISILHLNCQARFFAFPMFAELLGRLRRRGIAVIVHLHNLFTVGQELAALLTNCDRVFVHTPENRLEAIANGAAPDSVAIVPHGVVVRDELDAEEKNDIRATLGVDGDEALLITFGFIQPHKGLESLVEAVSHLQERGIQARGVIIGETRTDDPQSAAYLRSLRDLVNRSGVSHRISFITTFVPEEQVGKFLSAADIVIMNYRSQHFEASGACSLAVGAGAVVVTSLAPAMMAFGDAVWHVTAGYPVGLSTELLLTNSILRQDLRQRARAFADQKSWGQIAHLVARQYEELTSGALSAENGNEQHQAQTESVVRNGAYPKTAKPIRVLMQNRPNTFAQRGGDTILVERLSQGLAVRGYEVRVDVEGSQNPADYDVVHLFNFATPKLTRAFAERVYAAGRPFVITSLYEDIPSFHNQSHAVAHSLIHYVLGGQQRDWWRTHRVDIATVARADRFQADWIAQHAAAILVNGAGEAQAIRRDFPFVKMLKTVTVGHETGAAGDASLFEKTFGVRDFVLCVGRLESRKNQLMLLKALEDSEITVVLAAGGFSYQPEYDSAIRNFRRRGKTLILDRLTPEMLSAAYAACRIHALPSWYELPGLVTLEAASYGKNVVATRTGTSVDYLGDIAFYCDPADEASIRSAVLTAYEAPPRAGLVQRARSFTWERAIDETIAAYEAVLGVDASASTMSKENPVHIEAVPSIGFYDMSLNASEFEDVLDQGEAAAKNMEFERAEELLRRAESLDSHSPRALRALGAVMLAQSKLSDAQKFFDRAIALSPSDPKILTGRGMCDILAGRPADGLAFIEKALTIAPDNLVALYQMIECAYRLDQYDEAIGSLRRYLEGAPRDCEMRFCLAGCLYKVGEFQGCLSELERVLGEKTDHDGAHDLKAKVLDTIGDGPRAAVLPVVEVEPRPDSGVASTVFEELADRIQQWTISEATIEREACISHAPIEVSSATTQRGLDEQIELIESLKRSGKLAQAKELLDAILTNREMNPAQRDVVTCLDAEFKVIMGELEAAAVLYNKLLDKNPHLARALCGKGALAAEAQDWVTAQAFFETALDYDPNYDVAIAGVGLCKMVANRTEEAFNLFRRAATVNPENYRAILGVLQLGYPLKRYAEMECLVLAYLKRYPSNLDMLYSFAGLLYAQGRVAEARSQVEKILIAEPRHESALELREILDKSVQGSPVIM
jgi:glycosyltransferase involved in cell wall biosynthesis/Flp pilus assembly protein TadD